MSSWRAWHDSLGSAHGWLRVAVRSRERLAPGVTWTHARAGLVRAGQSAVATPRVTGGREHARRAYEGVGHNANKKPRRHAAIGVGTRVDRIPAVPPWLSPRQG